MQAKEESQKSERRRERECVSERAIGGISWKENKRFRLNKSDEVSCESSNIKLMVHDLHVIERMKKK